MIFIWNTIFSVFLFLFSSMSDEILFGVCIVVQNKSCAFSKKNNLQSQKREQFSSKLSSSIDFNDMHQYFGLGSEEMLAGGLQVNFWHESMVYLPSAACFKIVIRP